MPIQDDPYAASNGCADSLPPEESTSGPLTRSESPTGIGRRVAAAMRSSEFSDSHVSGLPVRRQGTGLNVSYESAMEMLGFGYGDV